MRGLLLAALLAVSCGPKGVFVAGEAYRGKPAAIAVAPARIWIDGREPRALFEDNLWVGTIQFSGGFEVVERDGGLQNQSVHIELDGHDAYSETARHTVDTAIASALENRDVVAWTPASAPLPGRVRVRGTEAVDDGHDNTNLPRYRLEPTPQPDGFPDAPAPLVLVPVVVAYYSHNGGWFVGQRFGAPAGARFRVFWTLWDAPTGEVVAWGDHDAKAGVDGVFSASSAIIEDYLIEVETEVSRTLGRRLP